MNLTDILYDTGYIPTNPNQNKNYYLTGEEEERMRRRPSNSSDEENLLLNITTGEGLGSYIPKDIPKARRKSRKSSAGSEGFGEATLNYSLLSDENEEKKL